MDRKDKSVSREAYRDIETHKVSPSEDKGRDEEVAAPLASDAVTLPVTRKVAELPAGVLESIFAMLRMSDFVRVHFGVSKQWRALNRSRVFREEPFFLRGHNGESDPPVAQIFSISQWKWVNLLLPPSVRHFQPVSASGGLLLFSECPDRMLDRMRRMEDQWRLVVVNPITRESRSLDFRTGFDFIVSPCSSLLMESFRRVHIGLKVNEDSKTYKVVGITRHSVIIFDSASGQWSTEALPTDLVSYADSSNELVFCCSYVHALRGMVTCLSTSLFDIGQGKLVDCSFAGLLQAEREADHNLPPEERSSWGDPSVGESYLYIVSYKTLQPYTSACILKRERSSPTWQLVSRVPFDVIRRYFDLGANPEEVPEIWPYVLECGRYLLFAVEHSIARCCAMVYDLDTNLWNDAAVNSLNPAMQDVPDGLFFQPQLYDLRADKWLKTSTGATEFG